MGATVINNNNDSNDSYWVLKWKWLTYFDLGRNKSQRKVPRAPGAMDHVDPALERAPPVGRRRWALSVPPSQSATGAGRGRVGLRLSSDWSRGGHVTHSGPFAEVFHTGDGWKSCLFLSCLRAVRPHTGWSCMGHASSLVGWADPRGWSQGNTEPRGEKEKGCREERNGKWAREGERRKTEKETGRKSRLPVPGCCGPCCQHHSFLWFYELMNLLSCLRYRVS